MRRSTLRTWQLLLALSLAALVATNSGCLGQIVRLGVLFGRGPGVPAECKVLKGKKVAVVCISDDTLYLQGSAAQRLAANVETLLARNVKDIQVIGHEKVADWIDTNDWDQIDFREIGRGVGADLVVGINLNSLSLHDGQTLFKGQANLSVKVHDMQQGGTVVFEKAMPDVMFPEEGGHPTASTTEGRFMNVFLSLLAHRVARLFHEYEPDELYALDAQALSEL